MEAFALQIAECAEFAVLLHLANELRYRFPKDPHAARLANFALTRLPHVTDRARALPERSSGD